MRTLLRQLLPLVLFSLFASACSSVSISKRPSSAPLRGVTQLVVLPLSYEGLRVGDETEAEWLAESAAEDKDEEKDEEGDESEKGNDWPADKAAWQEIFAKEVAETLGDGGITVSTQASGSGWVVA